MTNQNSSCCHLPICICGEAYRHLNDNNLSQLAAALTSQIADRMSAVHKLKHPVRTWPMGVQVPDTPEKVEQTAIRRHSLADVSKLVGIRPIGADSDYSLLYPGLVLGRKFKFKSEIEGEWVVTKITYFDEERGPKLQVASVVAQSGDVTMAFYTSHSDDLVDETMVPFYSMSMIENLPDRWNVVAEPAEHSYGKLQVGAIVGVTEEAGGLGQFKISQCEFYQKNFGLVDSDTTVAFITVVGKPNAVEDDVEFKLCVVDWNLSEADIQALMQVHYAIGHIDQLVVAPAQ